jgi:hypothetical protein
MAVFVTTVVAAVITALLGMASYLYQKQTDHQIDLSKRQQEAYKLYITGYYDWTLVLTGGDEVEMTKVHDNYWRAYYALFPLASDGFLRAAMAFNAYAMESTPDFTKEAGRAQFKALWTDLILEMRNDANVESRISEKEIEGHVPWDFSSFESKQGSNVDTSATPSSQERDE